MQNVSGLFFKIFTFCCFLQQKNEEWITGKENSTSEKPSPSIKKIVKTFL